MNDEKRMLITAINEHLPDYLESYLGVPVRMKSPDKSENFPCITPEKHVHGTDRKPSMGIHRREDGSLECHCFTCGSHLDLLDVIGITEGVETFTGKIERACEIFQIDSKGIKKDHSFNRSGVKKNGLTSDKTIIDLTPEAKQAHSQLTRNIREYFLNGRGLSNEVIDRFMLGYSPEGLGILLKNHQGLSGGTCEDYRIILPFPDENGKCSYLIAESYQNVSYNLRKNNGKPVNEKPGNPYRNLNGYSVPLWNGKLLKTSPEVIGVTEGIYDALSLETLGIPSIALCGVAGVGKFLKALRTEKPRSSFLLALDNDKAGQEALNNLKAGLTGLGIIFGELSLEGLNGKDCNETLMKDRSGLEERIKNSLNKIWELQTRREREEQTVREEIEERENRERDLYLLNTPSELLENYLERKRRERPEPIPTGFVQIDNFLDGGILPGLIILGAVSSLGKTTFALQIADNTALQGFDVLFLSLEMDKEEIADKSISRCSAIESEKRYGHVHNGLTLSDLNIPSRYQYFEQGVKKEVLEGALERYKGFCGHVFIRERQGSFTVNQVREAVETHMKYTGNKPIVVVDYLQIMDSLDVRLSDRQAIDKTVSELRSISKDFGIPVIVISSFNRASYEKEASFQSFKESSSIEYSSDVLLALEYLEDKETNDGYISSGMPIPIKFTLLKNRKGRKGKGELAFYPQYNYFCE